MRSVFTLIEIINNINEEFNKSLSLKLYNIKVNTFRKLLDDMEDVLLFGKFGTGL